MIPSCSAATYLYASCVLFTEFFRVFHFFYFEFPAFFEFHFSSVVRIDGFHDFVT